MSGSRSLVRRNNESEFADNQKVGERRTYDAKNKLIKTTKHKAT
jgi:hypothetical protein